MMLSNGGLWLGLVGFLVGAVCAWLRGGRIRAELSRARWAAEHDSLTGLPNRAGVRARYEADRCAGRPNSFVLLDLDGFKQVNDTYGHQVGDRLLVEVARRLTDACRLTGFPGRLAGDEFLILLPEPAPLGFAATIQDLLARIAAPITADGDTHPPAMLTVTASAGIATAAPEGTWTTQLRRADIALYHAKVHPGSTVLFQHGMQHPPSTSSQQHRPALAAAELMGASAAAG